MSEQDVDDIFSDDDQQLDANNEKGEEYSELDEDEYEKYKKELDQEDQQNQANELSSLSDDDDDREQQMDFQKKSVKKQSYSDDDDDDDDKYGGGGYSQEKSKPAKRGRKSKSEMGEDHMQQQSQKSKNQVQLQDAADAMAGILIKEMEEAWSKDLDLKKKQKAQIQKLKIVPSIIQRLKNDKVKESFAEEGLNILYNWLIEADKVSSITVRKRVLEILVLLNIKNSDTLDSDIVKHCIDAKFTIQNQSVKVHNYDKETRSLFIRLVDSWAPYLKK